MSLEPGSDRSERLPVADHLTTERLQLRPFDAADAAALAAYRSDPDTARFQDWSAPFDRDQAVRFIEMVSSQAPGTPGAAFQYAIAWRDRDGLIGDVMLAVQIDPRQVELGVTLAPDVRGHGVATEAITAVLDHVLLQVGGVHRVEARCDPRNLPSVALWERLGFRCEGRLIAAYWTDDEGWTDDVIFAVLAEEWGARAAGRRAPPAE